MGKPDICSYDIEQGETRTSSLKAKINDLEIELQSMTDLCSTLHGGTGSDAQDVLHRIQSVAGQPTSTSSSTPAATLDPLADRTPQQALLSSERFRTKENANSQSISPGPSSSPANGPSRLLTSESDLPDIKISKTAINNFYDSIGRFFYVSGREYGMNNCLSVYAFPQSRSKAQLCEMFAVMAIGCQYSPEQSLLEWGEPAYLRARESFEDALAEDSVRSMRISCLLIMYNIMHKSTSALSYLGELVYFRPLLRNSRDALEQWSVIQY